MACYLVAWTNAGILLIRPLGNKLQWNFNRNSYIFITENPFQYVICKMATILSRPQCVNKSFYNVAHATRCAKLWYNWVSWNKFTAETTFTRFLLQIPGYDCFITSCGILLITFEQKSPIMRIKTSRLDLLSIIQKLINAMICKNDNIWTPDTF